MLLNLFICNLFNDSIDEWYRLGYNLLSWENSTTMKTKE